MFFREGQAGDWRAICPATRNSGIIAEPTEASVQPTAVGTRLKIAAIVALLDTVLLGAGQRGGTPAAAVQAPTFRAEVEYVEVDTLVLDERDQFVRGLTKDDFILLEDGKPEEIAAFSLVDVPVELRASATTIESDIVSNERPFDGRVYVLVLDAENVSVSRTQDVRRVARQFIERNMGADDLMAVVNTGLRTDVYREFTSTKRRLLEAVDRFEGEKAPSATIAAVEVENRNTHRNQTLRNLGVPVGVADSQGADRRLAAQLTMRALKSTVEWFGGVRGRRRALVFISEGIDYDLTGASGQQGANPSANTIYEDIRQSFVATGSSNVVIYAIDPRGLQAPGTDTIGIGAVPRDPRAANLNPQNLNQEVRTSQESLRALSLPTGGFAAMNQNDITNAFERIVRDNSSYYVLAYYPQNPKRDGKFHRLEVRVKQPKLTVRARRGYVAPSVTAPAARVPANAGASATMLATLNSPLAVSGIPMRVFATPFKGAGSTASILLGVELPGRNLPLDGGALELSFIAIDGHGKVHTGRTDRMTLKLAPENRARVEEHGMRVLNRLSLAAGRYQLRVATLDVNGGAAGSVLYDIDVPDYEARGLSMSGLSLAATSGTAMLMARNDEEIRKVLPTSPVAQRAFSSNDELTVYAEVYETAGVPPHKVEITSTLTSDAGTALFRMAQERDGAELQGAGFRHVVRIPLTDMPAGRYVVTVEARSRVPGPEPVRREVPIQVTAPNQPSLAR
jgi:VWFA-related protein